MNCLITGGCGFIGRHFTKKMCDLGYKVDIVDNMVSKSALYPDKWMNRLKCNPDSYVFYEEDMLDFLRKTSKSYDIIIHAGAIVGGRETIENDPLLVSYNITTDNELFRWIEKNPTKYLVYFSSSAAYPIKLQTHEYHRKLKLEDIDIKNNNICVPDLTYGWSKLTGEFALGILSKRVDTNISVYRPFSGYGEDQHDSYPFPSIMKRVIAKCKEDKDNTSKIDIWSDAVRDFVYIDDVVEYVLQTCFHSNKLTVQNIGSGIATSMSELAKKVAKIKYDKEIEINILDNMPKGVYYRVSDDKIDYPITALDDGIRKSLDSGLYNL